MYRCNGNRTLILTAFVLAGCGGNDALLAQNAAFTVTEMAQFNEPWAMEFLPDGRLLVSEKPGTLKLWTEGEDLIEIGGIPAVAYRGQGGLGDIVLHPDFASNDVVYISYAEAGEGGAGAAVARATLQVDASGGELMDLEVIWRQTPKVDGAGHFGHRMVFDEEGYLWISSGERQKFDPAQDMEQNLGKIIRLQDDGSVPDDNPFAGQGGVAAQVWSLGHRNPLGLAFDGEGRLWEVEMGPRGGDEFNRIERGENYGWPVVSNGDHYDGGNIPDHSTMPEFNAPEVFWQPVISPSSLMIYSGSEFPDWQGNAFIGGLSSEAVIRVEVDGDTAQEAERFDMGQRIRAVEQGPDGAIWILEDERDGAGGRLLRLTSQAE